MMLKISRYFPVANKSQKTSSDTITPFQNLPKTDSNINYLKSFDTAFIAYYMMGFGSF